MRQIKREGRQADWRHLYRLFYWSFVQIFLVILDAIQVAFPIFNLNIFFILQLICGLFLLLLYFCCFYFLIRTLNGWQCFITIYKSYWDAVDNGWHGPSFNRLLLLKHVQYLNWFKLLENSNLILVILSIFLLIFRL